MRLVLFTALAILLAGPPPARGDSVTNEVIVNALGPTAFDQSASVITDALNGYFNVGDDWTLRGGASLTFEGRTPATGAQFGESGDPIALLSAGVDWFANDNLTLGSTFDFSPTSTQYVGVPISVRLVNADAQVRSDTSHVSLGFDASWDTLGFSNLEWSFDLGVNLSHYAVDQSVSQLQTASGANLTPQEFEAQFCAGRAAGCGTRLLRMLHGTPLALDFARLSADVTATLFADTDVSLLGDLYVYAQDPAQVGFPGPAYLGQGVGLPIAPLQFMIRPEVLHRFGDFSAKLWVQAGQYVSGTGQGTAGIGVRLQYRFSKAFRLWVTGSGQRDVDEANNVTHAMTLSAGAGYRW